MIRPALREALVRWREVIAAGGIVAAGIWLAGLGNLFFVLIGLAVSLAGFGLGLNAWRKLSLAHDTPGPGLVRVIEGQIGYFGPETGGFAALAEIEAVWVLEDRADGVLLRLERPDGPLDIPGTADGAGALFDALASLPGLDTARLARLLSHPPAQPAPVWRRQSAGPALPLT